jgi:hypothetical protein
MLVCLTILDNEPQTKERQAREIASRFRCESFPKSAMGIDWIDRTDFVFMTVAEFRNCLFQLQDVYRRNDYTTLVDYCGWRVVVQSEPELPARLSALIFDSDVRYEYAAMYLEELGSEIHALAASSIDHFAVLRQYLVNNPYLLSAAEEMRVDYNSGMSDDSWYYKPNPDHKLESLSDEHIVEVAKRWIEGFHQAPASDRRRWWDRAYGGYLPYEKKVELESIAWENSYLAKQLWPDSAPPGLDQVVLFARLESIARSASRAEDILEAIALDGLVLEHRGSCYDQDMPTDDTELAKTVDRVLSSSHLPLNAILSDHPVSCAACGASLRGSVNSCVTCGTPFPLSHTEISTIELRAEDV